MRLLVLVCFSAFACQSVPPGGFPSEYDFDPGPSPSLLSKEEISDKLEIAFDELFRLDPRGLFADYELAREQNDDELNQGCPFYDSNALKEGTDSWNGDCLSEKDAFFEGSLSSMTPPTDSFIDSDGNLYKDRALLVGDGRIFESSGGHFEMFGIIDYRLYSPPGSLDSFSSLILNGAIFWDGAGSEDSWLQNLTSGDFFLSSIDSKTNRFKEINISGFISGLPGEFGSILFSGIKSMQSDDGTTCDLEPKGTLFARDSAGYWYRIDFQGPSFLGEMGEDCDGCGNLTVNGEDLGMICPDLGRVLNWEERPW